MTSEGDSILQEGTQAAYSIVLKNAGQKNLSKVTIRIDGQGDSGIKYSSVSSDNLQVTLSQINGVMSVIGLIEELNMNEVVKLSLTIEAPILMGAEELKTFHLKAVASVPGMGDTSAKKAITIFRPCS